MITKNLFKKLIYILLSAFLGGIIAVIVWSFLKIMDCGIEFVWGWIPARFDIPFYTIGVCTLGGLLVGIYLSKVGAYPDELETVIEKVRKEKFYPYNKIFLVCIAALLPLIFGGSVGPEAGLTGIIVGLCYWARDNIKYVKSSPNLVKMGLSAALSTIFGAPLFGLIMPLEERTDNNKNVKIPKLSKIIFFIITVMSSFGVFSLLTSIWGVSMRMPHIDAADITNTERLWGVPLALIGVLFGYLYVVFDKITKLLFKKLQGKTNIVISTLLGGLILGIIGTYLPLTMFSGEEGIVKLEETFKDYSPWMLILIGAIKMLLTNICIKSGWRGGHFFPVIFSGISIGYGTALLTGLNISFCLGVVTAGILGVIMRKPIAVSLLLLLCFPVRVIPWLIISAFIGSIVPLGKIKSVKKHKEQTNEKQ